ncbi:MAG: MOSC domain-containing protein [Pseudomonadota bacterium]
MTAHLAHIWRHPIKGIGAEALEQVTLGAGTPLPGDRAWALRHEGAAAHEDWQPRRNFLVTAYGPALAAVTARTEADGRLTLCHPARPDLSFAPETEGTALIDWVRPLWPAQHSAPAHFFAAPPQGMADNGMAQVSIMNLSSLRALSQRVGAKLDMRRFRGNLWLDGLAPWEEFDLIGRMIRIGDTRLEITDRIDRCRATEANPETGQRDVDPCRALLDGYGHKDFGVYATVITGGAVSVGAEVTL